MIRLGITGGIGSGKTAVSNILKLYDVPVFDADRVAKELNESSAIIREQLIRHFGADIYDGEKLNRERFAKLIFQDKRDLQIANSIIHPEVANSFIEWCRHHSNYPVVAIDAALLIEAGFKQHLDKIVVVYAPKELRIKRVMQRDGISRSEVKRRMDSQLSEEEKIRAADFIIQNDERQSLMEQINNLLILLQ